ncbi:MAG: hypothetical protein GF344_16145 [Chitinivibrionales bacterium]|nr:hypothetical protein [Chitinivibrionales bacterium]MBD3358225.1 hypothetical protein [Chitinivibrionales bacterium]
MDERLTQRELSALLSHRADPCVSLYMPTYRDGVEAKEHPIRFRNLVADAQQQLVERGMKEVEADRFMAPLRDRVRDTPFWRQQSDGLAAFLSPSLRLILRLPHRLPTIAVVDRRLYIKPLIHFVTQGLAFHILAISQKDVRLYDGSPYGLSEVTLENVPRGLGEALQLERTGTNLQMHTGRGPVKENYPGTFRVGATKEGYPGTFHGQEPWSDKHKRYVSEFFHRMEDHLHRYWHNRTGPLIFAGVEFLYPLYAEVCRHQLLAEQIIAGNPDRIDKRELHKRALNIAQPIVTSKETAMEERYRSLAATNGDRTMDKPEKIVSAAYRGQVWELMVADDAQLWGTFDPETGETNTDVGKDDPGSEDLLDLSVVYAMENGGEVYARPHAEIPGGHAAIAVLRY